MCSFVASFFYSISCFCKSSVSLCIKTYNVIYYFIQLFRIPLCNYTTACFSIELGAIIIITPFCKWGNWDSKLLIKFLV